MGGAGNVICLETVFAPMGNFCFGDKTALVVLIFMSIKQQQKKKKTLKKCR